MKIRSQIGMVLNLDKCIGCHTCSITCKNVWTSREGMEYAWFNNVESKPGVGYPNEWENQDKWNGGWERKSDGKILNMPLMINFAIRQSPKIILGLSILLMFNVQPQLLYGI